MASMSAGSASSSAPASRSSAGACVWSRIGAVVYGVSQEDIAAYGRKHGTDEYKWRACLISCQFVFEKGNHNIPVTGGFLRQECQKLFAYRPGKG